MEEHLGGAIRPQEDWLVGLKLDGMTDRLIVREALLAEAERGGFFSYAAGVAYRQSFTVDKIGGRYKVCVPRWYGSVAKVTVNGNLCGLLVSQPWECDVTRWLKPGENTVEVIVIGTLKNTLGPHHGKPRLGMAWPGAFHQGPNPGPPPLLPAQAGSPATGRPNGAAPVLFRPPLEALPA